RGRDLLRHTLGSWNGREENLLLGVGDLQTRYPVARFQARQGFLQAASKEVLIATADHARQPGVAQQIVSSQFEQNLLLIDKTVPEPRLLALVDGCFSLGDLLQRDPPGPQQGAGEGKGQ